VTLDSLAERVRLLEAEREIMRSLFQYGHALDGGDEDQFLDCFTSSGTWVSQGARRQFKGTVGLRQFFANHTHAPDVQHKHLILTPLVTLAGDQATVQSCWVRLDEHPDGPYVRSFGRYTDRLVRCPDGRWRIEERLVDGDASSTRDFPPRPAWIRNLAVGEPF
jgi:ketosteroid isomerase-like protein